jgi:hypothetical protein
MEFACSETCTVQNNDKEVGQCRDFHPYYKGHSFFFVFFYYFIKL